jgi:hypothetical protein
MAQMIQYADRSTIEPHPEKQVMIHFYNGDYVQGTFKAFTKEYIQLANAVGGLITIERSATRSIATIVE